MAKLFLPDPDFAVLNRTMQPGVRPGVETARRQEAFDVDD